MKNWKRIAERQLGLITWTQLRNHGVTPSQRHTLSSTGELVAVHRNVYRIDGSPPTLDQRRLAALLATDAGVLSHRAAAAVWGARSFQQADPELLVPMSRSARLPGIVVHRSRDLRPGDVMAHQHYPRITRPFRTVMDLATLDIEDDVLEEAGADLLLAFRQDQRRLRREDRNGGGLARVRRLFGEYLDADRRPPHPGLERRLLGAVQASSLPGPVVHFSVATPEGPFDVDLAWPDVRLAVEADSARWHSSPANLRTDRTRDRALAMVGWAAARFTWEEVRDRPDDVVRRIATIHQYRSAHPG